MNDELRRLREHGAALERELASRASTIESLRAELRQLGTSQVLELETQRMEAITRLAGGLAHELNTPVQYISGNLTFLTDAFRELVELADCAASALADGAQTPAERLASMERAVAALDLDFLRAEVPLALAQCGAGLRQVSAIVQSMKTFARPGASELEPTDLHELIATTLAAFAHEWKAVCVPELALEEGLPHVPLLRVELGRALVELVKNAAEAVAARPSEHAHTPGSIVLATRVAGESVELSIVDNGIGIPESHRARIFDPFFTTKAVGQGAGLCLVRSVVVDRHRGRVSVESSEGEGSAFVLSLPLAHAAR